MARIMRMTIFDVFLTQVAVDKGVKAETWLSRKSFEYARIGSGTLIEGPLSEGERDAGN